MKNLYLPITHSTVSALLDMKRPKDWFQTASTVKVASVLVLLQVPLWISQGKSDVARRWAEPLLRDLLDGTQTPKDLYALRAATAKAFQKTSIKAALGHSEDSGVFLAKEGDLEKLAVQPLTATGTLSSDYAEAIEGLVTGTAFNTRQKDLGAMRLSDPQGRALAKAISEPDESMSIQGYAGSGKGVLIEKLTGVNTKASKLILALTYSQLTGIMARIRDPRVKGKTFGHLARDLVGSVLATGDINARSGQNYNVSDERVADLFNWPHMAHFPRATVAQIVRRTVMSFCATTDDFFRPAHLPSLADKLPLADQRALVIYSERYWSELFAPAPGMALLPVRGYHLIKYAALRGLTIPAEFDQVIVEEAQDLSGPMAQILDRDNVSVITLGDKFQRFQGAIPKRSGAIRVSHLDVSMRSGTAMEPLLNPLIGAHPFASGEPPLKANASITTDCQFYDRPALPDGPCTMLVGSYWHMLQWFQQLLAEDASFCLLPASSRGFNEFVQGIIGLYHKGQRSQNSMLFRYPTWESLRNETQTMKAFGRVEYLLKRGYNYEDFNSGLKKMTGPAKATYKLGRADDARNLEFDSVMLTPELFSKITTPSGLQTGLSRIYVGASRARYRLVIPGYMKDWIKDVERVKPGGK